MAANRNTTIRSPRFYLEIESGALAANGVFFHDFTEDDKAGEQVPFNFLIVKNFASNVELELEYGATKYPMRSSEDWIDDRAYGLHSIKITNLTNQVNNGKIYIMVERIVKGEDVLISQYTGSNLLAVSNGNGDIRG